MSRLAANMSRSSVRIEPPETARAVSPRTSDRAVDLSRSLVMTDWLLLLVFMLAAFWALDPLQWNLDYRPRLKHLPALLLGPVLVLVLAGQLLRRERGGELRAALAACWPLAALAVWITAGSLVARSRLADDNTFLNTGVFMVFAPLGVWIALSVHAFERWLALYLGGLCVIAIGTGIAQVISYGSADVIHNHEYLVAPFIAYFLLRRPLRTLHVLLALTFTAFVIAGKKNTAYLALLLCAVYVAGCWLGRFWSRRDGIRNGLLLIAAIGAACLVAAGVAFLFVNRELYLPSGNTNFRLFTYAVAWDKFLASPIWGTSFTGPASEFFPLYTINIGTQVVPTHSDPLDLLANGGAIGFVLWVWGVFRLLRSALMHLGSSRCVPSADAVLLHTLVVIGLCLILTCTFNPVLLHPNGAWLGWSALGFAAGLAMRATRQARSTPA